MIGQSNINISVLPGIGEIHNGDDLAHVNERLTKELTS